MNWKNLSIATLFAALSLGALNAQAQPVVQAHNYMYGEHLDIAKALATEVDPTPACGVVNAHLRYLDSQGQQQILNYESVSQNCPQDN